jgi:4-amino-4-deoxy-L-arabinose transferase-like glycosyltransferase
VNPIHFFRKRCSAGTCGSALSRGWVYAAAVLFSVIACSLAYRKNIERYESLQRPCLTGGSDQFDYNNMAYVFARFNLIGVLNSQEYKESYFAFERDTPFELTQKERRVLESRIIDPPLHTDGEPRPYAYRAWLYPVMLGTAYKVFGYDFAVARWLNIFLFGVTAAVVFLLANRVGGFPAGIAAGLIVAVNPRLMQWTQFLLTEVPSAMVLALAACVLYGLGRYRERAELFFLGGVFLAALVLTKKLFLGSAALVCVLLLFWTLRYRSGFAARRFGLLLVGLGVVLGPWCAYNVAVTRHASLFLGTNGWHDMPSSYSPEFLEQPGLRDFFDRRERIFKRYEELNGVTVRGNIERALVGKAIWKEMIADPEIQRLLPALFYKKIRDELEAPLLEWVFRGLAVVGIFMLGFKRLETLLLVSIPVGALLTIGIVHGDHGRLFATCFPLVAVFAGFGIAGPARGALRVMRRSGRLPACSARLRSARSSQAC